MAKRIPTDYVGVYYTLVNESGGKAGRTPKKEKNFIVTFKRPGERKQKEVTIGRASQGWTAARVSNERAQYIAGKLTKDEERAQKKRAEDLNSKENFTVQNAFDAYLEHLTSESKAQDKSRFRVHIKPICGGMPVSKLTILTLDEIEKAAEKKAPQTRKHILGLLRRVIYWCEKRKLCKKPDDLEFVMPKFDNQVDHEYFTEEELAVLIIKLREKESEYPVGSGLLQCAIYTGLRPKQMLNLKWSDIDVEKTTIKVRRKMRGENKSTHIPLNTETKELFERMLKVDDYVFPSSRGGKLTDCRYQIKKALDGIDLPETFRPMYSLRHNFASWFANLEGTDIYMLRDLLTHSDIRTTQRYAHLFEKNKKEKSDSIAKHFKATENKHRDKIYDNGNVGRLKIKETQ